MSPLGSRHAEQRLKEACYQALATAQIKPGEETALVQVNDLLQMLGTLETLRSAAPTTSTVELRFADDGVLIDTICNGYSVRIGQWFDTDKIELEDPPATRLLQFMMLDQDIRY